MPRQPRQQEAPEEQQSGCRSSSSLTRTSVHWLGTLHVLGGRSGADERKRWKKNYFGKNICMKMY